MCCKELVDGRTGAGHAIDQQRMGQEINADGAAAIHRQTQKRVDIRSVLRGRIAARPEHIAVKVKSDLGQTSAAIPVDHKAERGELLRHAALVIQCPGDAVAAVQVTTAQLDPIINAHARRIDHRQRAICCQLADCARVHPSVRRDCYRISRSIERGRACDLVPRGHARQNKSGFTGLKQFVAVPDDRHKGAVHHRGCCAYIRGSKRIGSSEWRHPGLQLKQAETDLFRHNGQTPKNPKIISLHAQHAVTEPWYCRFPTARPKLC